MGHDREYCIERNWTDKITKIESMLKMWREQSLTLLGKILIIKALALPLVSFVALNCYTPDWIVKAVSKIFFCFCQLYSSHVTDCAFNINGKNEMC